MSRYLVYSTFFHAAGLSVFLFLANLPSKPTAYYGFQFLGGQSGFGTGTLEPAPASLPSTNPGRQTLNPSPEEGKIQPSDDTARVAVAKKSKLKKKGTPAPPAQGKNLSKKGGEKGGRGESALGHGDFQGSKTGPVGGVGTSLEIGGFGPGGAGNSTNQFPFKWYGELIYKRLWEAWDRTDAGTLECKVAFKILKDGKVSAIKVKSSSGDSLFDMTAKRAILSSAPFPPLPEGFKETELPILVRFRLQ